MAEISQEASELSAVGLTGDERSVAGEYQSPNPDPSAADAGKPRIFAATSSVGDSAAAVDKLGFELYVNAIADFLVAPNTRAPLTCSIEGSWGSGKSSFMLQLKKRLATVAPDCRTIEFNAWKYDKQEELWAAFALKVTRSLRERMRYWERVRGEFHLFRSRIKGWGERLSLLALLLTWLLLLTGSGGVIIWTVRTTHPARVSLIRSLLGPKPDQAAGVAPHASSAPSAPLDPWYEWLAWSPLATATLLIVLLIGKIPESFRKRLFEARLETYIDKPDYKGKAAFVDTFSEDFSRMIKAYAPPKDAKIFVFIDDLDRCEAPKAADLMQAINLMIGDGNPLIFVLGLDRVKVASAIAYKFRDIIPYLEPSIKSVTTPEEIRRFGDTFLEKFIQLSFRLPISSNERQARIFIDSLITDAAIPESKVGSGSSQTGPEEGGEAAAGSTRRALRIESGAESQRIRDVVMMVREIVDYSPRRIKTFLNAFRLGLYIASCQGLLDVDSTTGEAEVTPERLGKFLVLTSRYPELRSVIDKEPTFLHNLERLALNIQETSFQTLERDWLIKPGVRKLMTFGIDNKTLTVAWERQYSMKNFPAGNFDTILPVVPPPPDAHRTGDSAAAQAPTKAGTQPASTAVPDTLVTSTEDLSRRIKDAPPVFSNQEIVSNDAVMSTDSPTETSMVRERSDFSELR
ncbi:MAG TPA: P-loop NTPase fold protein [Edaphobacter sp.]|jgi:hypothetical protein|nr:P-loop NTPase fold protein [Edaphobacter sp.]